MKLKDYILPLGVLAIIGVGGYYLLKKLPGIFGSAGGILRGIFQGAEVGGIPGAVGGGIYETFVSKETTLRERILERISGTDEPYVRAGAGIVAEDIHAGPFDSGFIGAILPPFSGFTIGAGLATIQKWGEWLGTLPAEQYRIERWGEYRRREKWMSEHPIETTIGFMAPIIHGLTQPTMLEAPTSVLQKKIDLPLGVGPSREEVKTYRAEITERIKAGEIPPRIPAVTVLEKPKPTVAEIEKIRISPIVQTPIGQMIARDLLMRRV